MKRTFTSAYTVRALIHLAHSKTIAFIPSHVIAAAEDISEHFHLTLLRRLVSARILHGVRGRRGGYRLAPPAERITLLDVIEAVEGPLQQGWRPRRPEAGCTSSCSRFANSRPSWVASGSAR